MKHPPIGLSGFAKSGKTTAAQYLEKFYGYQRLHIADPLRDMLKPLLAAYGYNEADQIAYLEGTMKESNIPLIAATSRHLQISLGTEWGRNCVSNSLWSRLWGIRADRIQKPAMNDSVRFPNEEDEIHKRDGFTILIVREGVGPAAFKHRFGKWLFDVFGIMWGVHDSERTDRLNPDIVIHNTGSVEQLYRMLDRAMVLRDEPCLLAGDSVFHLRPIATPIVSP